MKKKKNRNSKNKKIELDNVQQIALKLGATILDLSSDEENEGVKILDIICPESLENQVNK